MLLIWAQNYNASLKVKEDLILVLIFQHVINCQDLCSTCGQRYHCDLLKKRNYFIL